MNSIVAFFLGLVFIAHVVLTVSSAESNGTTAASAPTTTKAPGQDGTILKIGPVSVSTNQKKPEKGKEGEEDCDEPEPEPEGVAGKTNSTSTDRQGKELKLGEKDKYTHENATSEPEPIAEHSGNGTDSGKKDKLTGSNSTAHATGTGSAIFSGYHAKCGAILGTAVVYLTACFVL